MSWFASVVRGIGGILLMYAAAVIYFDRCQFWPRFHTDTPFDSLLSEPMTGVIAGLVLVVVSGLEVSRTEYSLCNG